MSRPARSQSSVACAAAWLALGMTFAAPGIAGAQASTAGWLAMVTSPYGALVPGVTPAMLGTADEAAAFGGDLEFRYGRLDDGATVLNSIGIGARLGNLGLTGVWQNCDGCGSRSLAGIDYDFILARVRRDDLPRTLAFAVGARPGLGLGIVSGEGDAAYAVATTVDVPLSLAIPVGARIDVIPHIEPGFGNGLVIQGGERDSRFHATIAAGVTLMNIRPGLGINVGWRRIFLGGAPGTWGVGLTFRRSAEDVGLGQRAIGARGVKEGR